MCGSCWLELGHPTIWNENIQTAVNLINQLYELSPTGSPLHPELDDWNLEGSMTVYPDLVDPRYVTDGRVDDLISLARQISAIMVPMSHAERISTMAHEEGLCVHGELTDEGTFLLENQAD